MNALSRTNNQLYDLLNERLYSRLASQTEGREEDSEDEDPDEVKDGKNSQASYLPETHIKVNCAVGVHQMYKTSQINRNSSHKACCCDDMSRIGMFASHFRRTQGYAPPESNPLSQAPGTPKQCIFYQYYTATLTQYVIVLL